MIVGDASLGARSHIDQLKIWKLGDQFGRAIVKIGLSGKKKQLIVGNLRYITLSQPPVDLLSGLLQTIPQRWAQIWIKREKAARRAGQGDRLWVALRTGSPVRDKEPK